ncbi:MAG TPA: hypothetical protein VHW02_07880 [Rhizomicrobium sp.]|jgi:hypothetical protein|nr:hypothetical protein [Rhizomicrobium sp.]
MANKYPIVVTAIDNATAVVKRINERFSRLTRPITQIQGSVKALGKELGVDKLATGLGKGARAAQGMAEKVASIIAPLTAVTGLGSIAGVVALGREWSLAGAEVGRTAQTLGISATKLQLMTGAASYFGIGVDTATESLKTFGSTLEDALFGRNQQAMMLLNRLHIHVRKNKDGVIDTMGAMDQLADRIAADKRPQVQALMARQFGVEALLPYLRLGSKGMKAYQDRVRATGALLTGPALAAATRFQMSLANAKLSVEGLGNSIFVKLIPAVQPLIDMITKWITQNRALIATKVTEFIAEIVKAVKSVNWRSIADDIRDFCNRVNSVVEAIGGWKRAIEILIGLKVASYFAGMVLPMARLAAIIPLITARLWPLIAAAAIFYAIKNPPRGNFDKGHQGDMSHWHPQWMLDKNGQIDQNNFFNKSPLDLLFPNRTWLRSAPPQETEHTGSSRVPRGILQHNPGNLRSWGNAPIQGGFAKFQSDQQGISALAGQLVRYGQRGIDTISGIVNKYAPAKDHNNVPAYIADLVKRTGFTPNQHLNLADTSTLRAMVSGIISHEEGHNPYSADLINKSVDQRLAMTQHRTSAPTGKIVVDFQNQPPGTRIKHVASSGIDLDPRFSVPMPVGGL